MAIRALTGVRALDATSGKVLWEQTIGGPIANRTITYSVNGQQYLAGRHHGIMTATNVML